MRQAVSTSSAPKAIGHMDSGYLDAMVVQNPYEMGYQGVRLMKALVEDDGPMDIDPAKLRGRRA